MKVDRIKKLPQYHGGEWYTLVCKNCGINNFEMYAVELPDKRKFQIVVCMNCASHYGLVLGVS